MKLSDLMKNITPNPSFEGFVMADNYVLAVNVGGAEGAANVGNYAVVQVGVEGVESSLMVNTDEGGNAGDNSTFAIELSKSGDMPEAYTWSAG